MLESDARTAAVAGPALGLGPVVSVVVVLVEVALWAVCAVVNGRGVPRARVLATSLGGLAIVLGALGLLFLAVGCALDPLGGATADAPAQGLDGALNIVQVLLAAAILVLLWRPTNAPLNAAGSRPRP